MILRKPVKVAGAHGQRGLIVNAEQLRVVVLLVERHGAERRAELLQLDGRVVAGDAWAAKAAVCPCCGQGQSARPG